MGLVLAIVSRAVALWMDRSQSLTKRRQRPSHAKVCPTTRAARQGLIRKFLRYRYRHLALQRALKTLPEIKIILGAAETHQKGWYFTNEQWLDITSAAHWNRLFFEHLTRAQAVEALRIYAVISCSQDLHAPQERRMNKSQIPTTASRAYRWLL